MILPSFLRSVSLENKPPDSEGWGGQLPDFMRMGRTANCSIDRLPEHPHSQRVALWDCIPWEAFLWVRRGTLGFPSCRLLCKSAITQNCVEISLIWCCFVSDSPCPLGFFYLFIFYYLYSHFNKILGGKVGRSMLLICHAYAAHNNHFFKNNIWNIRWKPNFSLSTFSI